MLGRAIVATLLAAAVCSGQVSVKRTTSGGSKVSTGYRQVDPAKELQKQRRACAKRIAEARAQLAGKKWGQARMTLDRCRSLAADRAQAQTIGSLYVQIDREGSRQLAAARQAYRDGQFLKAISQFKHIRNTFGWLNSGRSATGALLRAKADPSAQSAVQEAKARPLNKRLEKILTAARPPTTQPAKAPTTSPTSAPSRASRVKKLPLAAQARAVKLLERIAKACPLAPSGRRAASELGELQADEAFSNKLAAYRQSRKAAAVLKSARMYHDSGMTRKAVTAYQKVLNRYPNSDQADQAKRALAQLGSPVE